MNAEEKYQAELKQSDLDHHQPTAAAMTGHIILGQNRSRSQEQRRANIQICPRQNSIGTYPKAT